MNCNISARNNQAFSQSPLYIAYWLGGSTPASFVPVDISNKVSSTYLDILKEFICLIGVYGHTYVTHQTIADRVGCHQDTVLRASRVFKQLGILTIVNRGANRSCVYSLGKVLKDIQLLWLLKDILPNLYWAYNNSSLAIRKMLPMLFNAASLVKNQITARLSNDKNKDILISYTRERREKKVEEFIPSQEDIIRLDKYLEHEKRKKEDFSREMALILGISP